MTREGLRLPYSRGFLSLVSGVRFLPGAFRVSLLAPTRVRGNWNIQRKPRLTSLFGTGRAATASGAVHRIIFFRFRSNFGCTDSVSGKSF